MSNKLRGWIIIAAVLLTALVTIGAVGGGQGPFYQTGMDMSTATMQPGSTQSLATAWVTETPTPSGADPQQGAPSPTMTSIFTGFTPNPNAMSTYTMPMVGSGMMGGGMMGSSPVMTGTMGTTGMGMGGMAMSGCPMMSGSSMGSGSMSGGMSMSGMDMDADSWMVGMDMSMTESAEAEEASLSSRDPWWILGWVVLGLVLLTILLAAVLGIIWIIRRTREIPQAQP